MNDSTSSTMFSIGFFTQGAFYVIIVLQNLNKISLTHYQTTNFRLFQTERVCRRQFQIRLKWKKVIQMGKKTRWEKEKLLVTSNFSFSHCVFKRLVSKGHQKVSLCGNGLTNNLHIILSYPLAAPL